ncbi:MAG: hypothetical protein IPJ30_10030 [Acidobacteria bacterium]|nr:hypothetical protein [Acidobacteriota bacterium]
MRPIEQTGGEAPRISKAANDTANQFICDLRFRICDFGDLGTGRSARPIQIQNPKSKIAGGLADRVQPPTADPRRLAQGSGTRRDRIRPRKPFLGFFVDEADGVADYVFKAMSMMASGGISIVLMTANPRLRSSAFHRLKKASYVKALRISSLYHPNVVQGKEVIPGAVMRDFIERQIEKGCQIVHLCRKDCPEDHRKLHRPDEFTFGLVHSLRMKLRSVI